MKVTNIRKKEQKVNITLADGKARVLYFDLNAFAELEKRYGSVQAAMKSLQDGKMKDVKVVMWAGLIHEEVTSFDEDGEPTGYNITPFQVGNLISAFHMEEASRKLGEAMGFALPDQAEVDAKVQEQLKDMGIELPPEQQLATVVLTEEEKAAEEAERKNV